MKKVITLFCLIFLLSACGNTSDPQQTSFPIELVGNWKVTGIIYENRVVDIESVDGLKDLYDQVFLNLKSDGSFIYYNAFTYKGTANELQLDNVEQPTYMMTINTSSRAHMDNGKVIDLIEEYNGNPYILIYADNNTIVFSELDPKAEKMGDIPFVMKREK